MSADILPLKPADQSADGKDGKQSEEKKPQSAEQLADKETKLKKALQEWADETVNKVIEAVRADVALRFHERDADYEEELDLKGEFDPIVVEKTGQRLSELIEEFAEQHQLAARMVKRVYTSKLKEKWEECKDQHVPNQIEGQQYGKNFVSNRHGVWTKQFFLVDGYVLRRITRTRIDHVALSYDTTPQHNWRHRYQVTNELGEFDVEIGSELLGGKPNARSTP